MRVRPAIPLAVLAPLAAGLALGQSAFSAAAPGNVAQAATSAPRPVSPLPGAAALAGRSAFPRTVRAPGDRGRPVHRVAVLRRGIGLRSRPGGPVDARLAARTEFGSKRVLGVAARRGRWLGVVTSARPNGRLAWIARDSGALRLRRTGYSLHADLSDRRLELRRGGRRLRRLGVAVGAPGSATPTGRFAVTDKLPGSRFGPYYGCCVLALSGHQPNTPRGWPGGNRLAIHGTDAPDTIGSAASAGCLRAADADLAVLMRRVPLGTPVFIRR